ncbi:hypothetical protein PMIN06_006975 [Paraphaeosphaeria minitans]|uniref:Uncharacterized protein n=1 Tax=Paraphaeosphaeria minitans TaxID=565426 RepID=A0A9P6GQ97_9PLEO|nr:hypothetical protein PMIN01_02223 [Paraphaeosphaeria minitans]
MIPALPAAAHEARFYQPSLNPFATDCRSTEATKEQPTTTTHGSSGCHSRPAKPVPTDKELPFPAELPGPASRHVALPRIKCGNEGSKLVLARELRREMRMPGHGCAACRVRRPTEYDFARQPW